MLFISPRAQLRQDDEGTWRLWEREKHISATTTKPYRRVVKHKWKRSYDEFLKNYWWHGWLQDLGALNGGQLSYFEYRQIRHARLATRRMRITII